MSKFKKNKEKEIDFAQQRIDLDKRQVANAERETRIKEQGLEMAAYAAGQDEKAKKTLLIILFVSFLS